MPSKPKLHQPSEIDVDALIAGARLPERPVPMCLRGDLQYEYEVLEQRLADAQGHPGAARVGEGPEVTAVRDQLAGVVEDMKAATVVFRIRGLSDPEWQKAIVDNPPRDGNEDDHKIKYNQAAVEKVMVRTGCVWPELTDAQWDDLDTKLTSWQRQNLIAVAWLMGQREMPLPFSFAESPNFPGSAAS